MNRKIDNMGRIVIPMEIRKQLGIETNDDLKIEVLNDKIVISKLETNNKLDELLDLINYWQDLLEPEFEQRAIEIIKGKTQNK